MRRFLRHFVKLMTVHATDSGLLSMLQPHLSAVYCDGCWRNWSKSTMVNSTATHRKKKQITQPGCVVQQGFCCYAPYWCYTATHPHHCGTVTVCLSSLGRYRGASRPVLTVERDRWGKPLPSPLDFVSQ